MLKNLKGLVALACITASCLACGPRGESKTLDEVFSNAREQFARAGKSDVSQEVGKSLDTISKQLDKMAIEATQQSAATNAKDVLAQLETLVNSSGYTVRPAMTELIKQYQEIVANPSITESAPQIKLLAARTYQLLASEIETTKFKVM